MKTAWTTLAILAALGIFCCGGTFIFGWQSLQLSRHANREAAAWAQTSFPTIATHWDSKAWQAVDQPDRKPDPDEIPSLCAKYQAKVGGLLKLDKFVPTSTYIVTTGKGLEFTVTLSATAEFEHGPAEIILKAHHALGAWTLQSLDLKIATRVSSS